MIQNCLRLIISTWFLLVGIDTVSAFPSGAGGCMKGKAAVGGPHLSSMRNITMGSLEQGKFEVTVDGKKLKPNMTLSIHADKEYDIVVSVRGRSKAMMKGILIRVETPAMASLETDSLLLQPASACAAVNNTAVHGITHNSPVPKKNAMATLMVMNNNQTNIVYLDVTVVVANMGDSSIFYYSGYTLTSSPKPKPKPKPKQSKGSRP
jgi:hypothetical protein